MKEETKDKVERAAAVGAQIVMSAFPIVGGPVSTAWGHVIENAQLRRNERLLAAIRRDLDVLIASDSALNLDEVLQSDQFLANLTIAFRAMQETANEERIGHLRRALVSSVKSDRRSRSEGFLDALVRLTPIHIQVLSTIISLSENRPKSIEDGTSKVRNELSARGWNRSEANISHICDELAVEGFLVGGSRELAQAGLGRKVRLTGDGVAFYKFVSDASIEVDAPESS